MLKICYLLKNKLPRDTSTKRERLFPRKMKVVWFSFFAGDTCYIWKAFDYRSIFWSFSNLSPVPPYEHQVLVIDPLVLYYGSSFIYFSLVTFLGNSGVFRKSTGPLMRSEDLRNEIMNRRLCTKDTVFLKLGFSSG